MGEVKKLLKKISDIPNALRVLEIMDECSVDIVKVSRNGFDNLDYWEIKPKHYISKEKAEELRRIVLYKEHCRSRSKLWKIIFPNYREGYRFL